MPTDPLRQNLRRAYSTHVGERDAAPAQPWRLEPRAAFLAQLQAERATSLLEIGAGTGRDAAVFAAAGLAVTAIDLTPENVAACRQKGLEAYIADVCELRLPNAPFSAAYSVNCLLHLPKAELPTALESIRASLSPAAPFYLCLYGGPDQEGPYDEDMYDPPRFFSFFSDAALKTALAPYFDIELFTPIPINDPDLHMQSVFLRARTPMYAPSSLA